MKCRCWRSSKPEVEHLDDVGVHQPGRRQGLAAEARHERGVVGEVLGQQLDRDVALQALVEREVDGRHAADAEAPLEPVAAGDRHVVIHWPLPLPLPLPPAVAVAGRRAPARVGVPGDRRPRSPVQYPRRGRGCRGGRCAASWAWSASTAWWSWSWSASSRWSWPAAWSSVSVVGVVSVWVCVSAGRHSRRASWATVRSALAAGCCAASALTELGRLATALASSVVALDAPLQLPEDSSEETWSSWPLSVFAWSPESRPEPPPQATTNAAANPSPPARIARCASASAPDFRGSRLGFR